MREAVYNNPTWGVGEGVGFHVEGHGNSSFITIEIYSLLPQIKYKNNTWICIPMLQSFSWGHSKLKKFALQISCTTRLIETESCKCSVISYNPRNGRKTPWTWHGHILHKKVKYPIQHDMLLILNYLCIIGEKPWKFLVDRAGLKTLMGPNKIKMKNHDRRMYLGLGTWGSKTEYLRVPLSVHFVPDVL